MSEWGFTEDDLEDEVVWVWPRHLPVLEVFQAMETQWNYSASGHAVCLKYESLPVVLDAIGIRAGDRRQLLQDLRVMEVSALEARNKASNRR